MGGGDGAVAAQHLGRALGSNSMAEQGGEQPVDVKLNALDTQSALVLCNGIDGPGKAQRIGQAVGASTIVEHRGRPIGRSDIEHARDGRTDPPPPHVERENRSGEDGHEEETCTKEKTTMVKMTREIKKTAKMGRR